MACRSICNTGEPLWGSGFSLLLSYGNPKLENLELNAKREPIQRNAWTNFSKMPTPIPILAKYEGLINDSHKPGRSKIGGESSGDMPPIILAAPLIREIIRGAARFQPQASVEYFQVNFNKNQPRPAAKIG